MSKIFKIQVFFEKSHIETRPYYDEAVGWLCVKGFDARGSSLLDTFFVYSDFSDKKTLKAFKEKLDIHLLALSIRNCSDCAFIITDDFNSEEDSKISTWILIPPSDDGMQYLEDQMKSPDLLEKLKELRLFNTQVDTRTKLIFGVSLLAEWFDAKPKHCLTEDEQKIIIQNIKKIRLSNDKEKKVVDVIKDSNFLAEKNRNQRIIEAIVKFSNLDLNNTQKKVKELFTARGKSAHTTKELKNIKDNLDFLKQLFQRHIYLKYNFSKLKLH